MADKTLTSFFAFERTTSNGWSNRYLIIRQHLVIAWGTVVPGEPWDGPWIGIKFARNFVRFGVRGFICAVGVAK